MASSCKLSKTGGHLFSNPTPYRSVVCALQYVTLTRPELALLQSTKFAKSWQHLLILTGWQAREFYGTLKELSFMVNHILALDQWIDLLTKPLSTTTFVLLKDKLNVTEISHARPP